MAESLPDDTGLLIRYLDETLGEADRLHLEQRLAREEALRLELERLRLSVNAVKRYGIAEQVRAIHQQELKDRRRTGNVVSINRRLRTGLTIAASIIVVLVSSAILYLSSLSSGTVAQDVFVDYTLSSNRSGAGLTPIRKAYQQHQYNEVIRLSRSATGDEEEQLLAGIACIKTGNSAGAVATLVPLSQTGSTFRQDAQFYLVTAYLERKDNAAALQLMQQIHGDPNHLYHNQVTARQIRDVQLLRWKQGR